MHCQKKVRFGRINSQVRYFRARPRFSYRIVCKHGRQRQELIWMTSDANYALSICERLNRYQETGNAWIQKWQEVEEEWRWKRWPEEATSLSSSLG